MLSYRKTEARTVRHDKKSRENISRGKLTFSDAHAERAFIRHSINKKMPHINTFQQSRATWA